MAQTLVSGCKELPHDVASIANSISIAVHLAEELKDAAYMLPRAMISSALINYATALTMIISLVSAIDPDMLEDILATTTGQPWVSPQFV